MGFALFGTTVLIPQLLQTLMGYTAQTAGMALAPGALTMMVVLLLVGKLAPRCDPRKLGAFGFLITAIALYHMTTINLEMDFWTAAKLRVFQSAGVAVLFVPINIIAFADLPGEKNNSVSGLINLARNIGGSFGISVVTTALARRSQYHQHVLIARVTDYDASVRNMVNGLSQALSSAGADRHGSDFRDRDYLHDSLGASGEASQAQ
jgi:DHA2 family multidrug resistance protein